MSNLVTYNAQAHHKAAQDAQFYTLSQLELFYKRASMGFLVSAIASFALSSFYIAQYLAGADFGTLADWSFMQVLYAMIGFGMAAGLTYGEIVLFNSGKTREFAALALVSIGFSIFAEVASTMQREAFAVSSKSQASGVYQANLKVVNSLAAASGAESSVQVQIAKYSDHLAKLHQQNASDSEIKQIERVLLNLQKQNTTEINNRTALLSQSLSTARELEYNERNHQQIIILMRELFGISFTQANAILAFALILTFKWMFSYLGNIKQRSERAIHIKEGTLGVTLDNPPVSLGHGVSVQSKSLPDPHVGVDLHARVENSHAGVTSEESTGYVEPENAKVGQVVNCKQCRIAFMKSNTQHKFCGSKCKDDYHNEQSPVRQQFIKSRK